MSIYTSTDKISPAISFHKSVAVDGGIVAKSASLGNKQCKLVVNDDGIYIVIPSKFDEIGNVSETNDRRYNLGAMVEAIQELNRRTAWMEPDMTLKESLIDTDVIDNTTGAFYNNVRDLLPGLKRTIPAGNHFRLVNINGDIIRVYQITDTHIDVLKYGPLITTATLDGRNYIDKLCKLMNEDDYTKKYISPRISKTTDDSFDILVLDTINDDSISPLVYSDAYYTYTAIDNNKYEASLKEGVGFDDICTNDNKITPPVPYIFILRDELDNNAPKQLAVTSISGLFKGQINDAKTYDFSDWDFSEIKDMSHLFDDCSTGFSVKYAPAGVVKPAPPAFIKKWDGVGTVTHVVLDADGELKGLEGYNDPTDQIRTSVVLEDNGIYDTKELYNYIWKRKDEDGNDQWFRFSYTVENNTYRIIELEVTQSTASS